jgi:hypothetical protein
MTIEMQQVKKDATEYKVLGPVAPPELHIVLARANPSAVSDRAAIVRLDLSDAQLHTKLSEVEQFIGHLEGVVTPDGAGARCASSSIQEPVGTLAQRIKSFVGGDDAAV